MANEARQKSWANQRLKNPIDRLCFTIDDSLIDLQLDRNYSWIASKTSFDDNFEVCSCGIATKSGIVCDQQFFDFDVIQFI